MNRQILLEVKSLLPQLTFKDKDYLNKNYQKLRKGLIKPGDIAKDADRFPVIKKLLKKLTDLAGIVYKNAMDAIEKLGINTVKNALYSLSRNVSPVREAINSIKQGQRPERVAIVLLDRSLRDLPGVVKLVNTKDGEADMMGAAHMRGKTLVTYHVTDAPKKIIAALKKKRNLVQSYGQEERRPELGPGLYASDNPAYWMARAAGKWGFLKKLTVKERNALSDKIAGELDKLMLSNVEYGRGKQYLGDYRKSGDDYLIVFLANQPYNIKSYKPGFLKNIGIRPGKQPSVVEIRAQGTFAQLSQYPSIDVLRSLRKVADGAFIKGSMAADPQIVIWNSRSIKSAKISR